MDGAGWIRESGEELNGLATSYYNVRDRKTPPLAWYLNPQARDKPSEQKSSVNSSLNHFPKSERSDFQIS